MFNGEKISRSVAQTAQEILTKGKVFRKPDDPLRSLTRAVEEKDNNKEKQEQLINENRFLKRGAKAVARHVGRNALTYGGLAYGASTGDTERAVVLGLAGAGLTAAFRGMGQSGDTEMHPPPQQDTPYKPPEEFIPEKTPERAKLENRLKGLGKFFKRRKKK